MNWFKSAPGSKDGAVLDESPLSQTVSSKIVRESACRPPKRDVSTAIHSTPIELADGLLESAYSARKGPDGERNIAEGTKALQTDRMRRARTAEEWRHAAEKLDILEGNHYWKFDEESNDCDLALLRRRLNALKQANHEGDMEEMLRQIRDALKRDLGGMCNARLYQHAHVGTKHLIEEYTEIVKYTIERIVTFCETSADEELVSRYLETMKAAKQSFGNTALMLSGGGTLGMCHVGVVKSLIKAKLLPKVICGASAGSIVASVLCTHKTADLEDKLDELVSGDLSVFQGVDELQGVPGMALNVLKGEPCFDISNLCRVMRALLGDITFKEAYNVTSLALSIHVSCRDRHNLPRLLNYITAPNVVIWTAVASSCALPCVFEPPGLQAKTSQGHLEQWGHLDHKWIDGSIEGDLPARTLERLFNVNNFIASQVNPHVGPLLAQEGQDPTSIRKYMAAGKASLVFALDAAMDQGLDIFPVKMARAILSQKYDGDITILPHVSWVPLWQILANPTHDFMNRATLEGEKATWPKLRRIHNSVAIELSLAEAVKQIQTRKVGSSNLQRPPSSTRSEQGLSSLRRKKNEPDDIRLVSRLARGRPLAHRSTRTMLEPLSPNPVRKNGHLGFENLLSSSDETRSGQSSPATLYDDEDFADLHDHDSCFEPTDIDRRTFAFLSQPNSPSLYMKSFWGDDSPPDSRTRQVPPSPTSPEMMRALNGLYMSAIDPPKGSSTLQKKH